MQHGTGMLVNSIVDEILTSSSLHLQGIKIRLQDEQVGRVKAVREDLYAQNTVEYITIYVKNGTPKKHSTDERERSRLSKREPLDYTRQVWNIPVPNKRNESYGKHPALMPAEIVRRCVKMLSFTWDVVLDPMCGRGTTLKMAKLLGRNYLGIDISEEYCRIARERVM